MCYKIASQIVARFILACMDSEDSGGKSALVTTVSAITGLITAIGALLAVLQQVGVVALEHAPAIRYGASATAEPDCSGD
jgi:hypothetical protein